MGIPNTNTSKKISIHALLAESDHEWNRFLQISYYFYPRSPCGERLPTGGQPFEINLFLSTLSLRRATIAVRIYLH